tara:strand:+ start:10614 stop:12413 length:1800 start_codon:yes stop_codon:yes gene_type:complete
VSDALDLIRVVLGTACVDDAQARALLEDALQSETDPLIHCAIVFGISEALATQRAADWAGLAFFEKVPQGLVGEIAPMRLENLAGVRLFRMQVLDRAVDFTAPDFLGFLRLKRRLRERPPLRQSICVLPPAALRDYLTNLAAPDLIVAARQGLSQRWPYAVAQIELTGPARWSFALGLLLLLTMALSAPFIAETWLLLVALALLVAPAAIRLAALSTPQRPLPPPQRPPDEELPIYSVLIPLHNEAAMVPQLFAAMWALDYPASRLDIKFVVEASSHATIAVVQARLGDPRVSLVTVPDAAPRTKPKALDYALPLCKGEHVVVYDAEDIPDPDQLWKAALRFREQPDLACQQARLLIDNGHRGWLAALFAAEYAALFSVLLPALARWRLPIPLGGTSNHFRVATLRQIGGWDAFNVTEDADLGMRLARLRLRVETLASNTREHAPLNLRNWRGQRTRWMKGWMQTFIVHNRNPGRLVAEMGWGPTLVFEVLVLGMIVAPLLHCGLTIGLALQLAMGTPLFDGRNWAVFYSGILVLGYASTFAITTLGLVRTRNLRLLGTQLLLPVYWLLITGATLNALRELLQRPFYWFKTPHDPVEGA